MMATRSQRLPGTGPGERGPELVLLPGWGFSARAWGVGDAQAWLTGLRRLGPVTLLEPGIADLDDHPAPWAALAEALPERAVWLGWSLGGMLATELAARYPERCLALITIASNACFVARPDWPHAMPRPTFQRFYRDVQASPEMTWRRFLGLCAQQPGSAIDTDESDAGAGHASPPNLKRIDPANFGPGEPVDARTTLRRLRELQPEPHCSSRPSTGTSQTRRPTPDRAPNARPSPAESVPEAAAPLTQGLLRGLDALAKLDTREALARLSCPTLHLFAAGDALVPTSAARAIAALNPSAQVAIIPGSHALHLSTAETVLAQLRELLRAHGLSRPQRDKRAVAQSFSRAARSYDAVAHLQQKVCRQLLQRLPDPLPAQSRWLDLGCGTGAALPELGARGRSQREHALIVALDLAEGMLRRARERWSTASNGAALSGPPVEAVYICGDAECLPLANASIDGIISSLAVQWCDDPDAVCAELARVLRPEGRAWVATLGPDTLGSLRRAWAAIDDRVHVNHFCQADEWQAAIDASGLVLNRWDESPEVLHYPDVLALARELKALGASNLNAGRPTGLAGRQRLAQLRAAYEQFRHTEGLPAEYQVWYLELQRPGSDTAPCKAARKARKTDA